MRKIVVVVEDNRTIRELIKYVLEASQFEVVAFGTATTFLSAAHDIRPDLYLLDIMLPDGDGIGLCKLLKSKKDTCKTPVIMMSAHTDQTNPECDAVDFIEKPFDIYNFISRIQRQIV